MVLKFRPRAAGKVPKGSAGGKEIEVLSEAMFCYYFAIWKSRKKTKFKEMGGAIRWRYISNASDVRKWTNELGISNMVRRVVQDSAFSSRINKVSDFLERNNQEWANNLERQMDAFFASPLTKFSGFYHVMRADSIPKAFNPYEVYEKVSQKVKQHRDFKESINPNKWNPADVWIFSPTSISVLGSFVQNSTNSILNDVEYQVGYMNELNAKIYNLYKLGQLYPVSLKAPGSGAVKVIEMNKLNPSYKKEVEYQGVEFTNNNLDVKLNFSVNLKKKINGRWVMEEKDHMIGRMKTKSATVAGFGSGGGSRLDIEISKPRGGARYGSIGTNIQQVVIEKTDTTGILQLDRIRHKFPELYKKYKWGGTGNWLGREQYAKSLKENQEVFLEEIQPYTNELYKVLNNSPVPWDPPQSVLGNKPGVVYVGKTHAGEIGVAVDSIVRKFMKSVVLENLFNVASSQQIQTGTAAEQLERRVDSLSNRMKIDINKFPPIKADLIWKSGFHLVVK